MGVESEPEGAKKKISYWSFLKVVMTKGFSCKWCYLNDNNAIKHTAG